MNIDDLTLGQIKEIKAMTGCEAMSENGLAHRYIGKKCIIRTYSAGCWFGVVSETSGDELILTNARRMFRWCASEGISLSSVALHGIKRSDSKIVEAIESVWLQQIEILPCSAISIESIGGADNVKAS